MIYPKQLMTITELTEMGFSRYQLNIYANDPLAPVIKHGRGKAMFDTTKLDDYLMSMKNQKSRKKKKSWAERKKNLLRSWWKIIDRKDHTKELKNMKNGKFGLIVIAMWCIGIAIVAIGCLNFSDTGECIMLVAMGIAIVKMGEVLADNVQLWQTRSRLWEDEEKKEKKHITNDHRCHSDRDSNCHIENERSRLKWNIMKQQKEELKWWWRT